MVLLATIAVSAQTETPKPKDAGDATTYGQLVLLVTFLVTQLMQWLREKRQRKWQLEDMARHEAEMKRKLDATADDIKQYMEEMVADFDAVLPPEQTERLERLEQEVTEEKAPRPGDPRRQMYRDIVAVSRDTLESYYKRYPDRVLSERHRDIEVSIETLRRILDVLDGYTCTKKEEL